MHIVTEKKPLNAPKNNSLIIQNTNCEMQKNEIECIPLKTDNVMWNGNDMQQFSEYLLARQLQKGKHIIFNVLLCCEQTVYIYVEDQ